MGPLFSAQPKSSSYGRGQPIAIPDKLGLARVSWARSDPTQQTEDGPTLNTIHFRVWSWKKVGKHLQLKLISRIQTYAKCKYRNN